jgi:hypothetical protein
MKYHYVLIVALVVLAIYLTHAYVTETTIESLTDQWCDQVTEYHDPEAIYKLFCPDGNLVGTVSQVIRQGVDIKRYFDFFAKLPGIRIVSKQYNVSRVDANVFINTAFIKWYWDDLDKPITARMTFVFRGNCIFQLHSSVLPDLNKSLLKISGLN